MISTGKAAARRLAGSPKPAAVAGLGAAALSQAHHPLANPRARTRLPHTEQQVIRGADAGTPGMEAVQPPPCCQDNSSDALDRSSQPVLTDPPAETPLKPASVSSDIPGTSITPAKETDSLTQQDLIVNSSGRQEAVLSVSHRKVDSVGSLSHAICAEMPEASVHQTICDGEGTTGRQSDPISTAGVVKGVDGIKDYALTQNQQEVNASGLLQTVTGIALPTGTAQSGTSPANITLSRGPAVAALRRPFSWRKHGRSWRYMTSKK